MLLYFRRLFRYRYLFRPRTFCLKYVYNRTLSFCFLVLQVWYIACCFLRKVLPYVTQL
jgi:hypothetical protein